MRLPESRKKELLTIWYAATLTPRTKRLSKREIASVDVTNICNIMLDDTKDPITFPVIAALLLGAAKVLQQQSLMIYSDVLLLWSRLRPRIFEPKATDSIDLANSVAKIKNITLVELEATGSDDGRTSLLETYSPFAELFDWTYVSPPLPSISSTIIINHSGSINLNDINHNDNNHNGNQQDQLLLQPENAYDYDDYDDYPFEEQFNRMNSTYLMSPVYLESENYDNNSQRSNTSEDARLANSNNNNEQRFTNEQQQQDYSIPDLLTDEYQDTKEINNVYDDDDLITAIINDQRRLFRDSSFSPVHRATNNSILSLHQQQQIQLSDINHDDDYYEGSYGVVKPTSRLPAILSQPSTLATEDISGLISLNPDDVNEEIDEGGAFKPITTAFRRRRRQRGHTTTLPLIIDSTTVVSASFYQQQESLVNRINPNQIFLSISTTNNQKKKNTKKAQIEKIDTIKQLIYRPLVSVEVSRSNIMWNKDIQDAMNVTLTSTEIELERARQNQQTNHEDEASVPSSMDDILLGNSLSSGADHQRVYMSRERSDSSESLLLESSDDDDQRKRLLARSRIATEFSRVPEDDYYDDYMDYGSGHEDEIFPNHQDDGTKMLVHNGDADDFLSYAQWKMAQQEEPVITLETLLSPIAHRSEVVQTFYHLLVCASRNKLRVHQANALETIQVYLGADINMVNAATPTHSSVEQETK